MRVTVTGGATNYGRIGGLVARIEQPPTPLERVVQQLVRRLGMVAILFCIGLVALGLFRGQPWEQALIAGVSLAMAAIPEEFPMVFTLYLTLGAWRLTRSRALVRRLSGVEALLPENRKRIDPLPGNTPGTPPSNTPAPPCALSRQWAPAWMDIRPATCDIGASRGSPPWESVTVS